MQTQHLIFIFDEVHRTYIGFLSELIEYFWQPIIEKVNCQTKYLVMFWLDNQAKVCDSGIPLVYHHSEAEYPKIPLCLTQANRFSYKKLAKWLSNTDSEIDLENLSIENLLKESKSGVPELVYQKICLHCGSSWEGRLAQWLIQ
ncbi:hypothetical protein B4U84_07955 [Westiellopsis prolifica IICB1]|nr:hypothetical protein B4U84_07955 [Westiellopsis prolifica IICB1]